MIIIGKLRFYKPSEIKNILEEIYNLPYSESYLYKTFIKLDATIKIERTNYILEEFIKYLFMADLKDPMSLSEARKRNKDVKKKIIKKDKYKATKSGIQKI
ncbi:hypothetical protein [Borrelia sp. RT1S]|uniref:hypothetical protein n=1 Tax=Borrelia sp. RT1S TaxID=2898580 RepID=UPI001E50DF87|nr:hypothetical protein [Borrelia sp. RT1S]UGQ17716.1 hypothetical protein LSO05_04635 [Borrelia sp. RT1S]